MEIVCKQCNATYAIPDHKAPKKEATAKCKRCGGKIVVYPAAPAQKPVAAAPPPAAPAAAPAPATATAHDSALLEAYPQMAGFETTRYDLGQIMQPNKKGSYKTSLNKLKVKILSTIKTTLEDMLDEDEKVLRVAGGTAFYPIEIFLGNGALTMLYNRYAVVATDRRLVMVNTNHSMTKVRHYMYQIAYEDIKKIKRGLFRTSLSITRKNGKRRTYTGMKSAFTAELLEVINPRIDLQSTSAEPGGWLHNLCPACYCALDNRLASCASCQSTFKTPTGAAIRSLLLPGLGDLYLGHHFLGVLEMIGAGIVWMVALFLIAAGGVEGVTMAGILLLFYNGLDALLTLHMGKKGYILAQSKITK